MRGERLNMVNAGFEAIKDGIEAFVQRVRKGRRTGIRSASTAMATPLSGRYPDDFDQLRTLGLNLDEFPPYSSYKGANNMGLFPHKDGRQSFQNPGGPHAHFRLRRSSHTTKLFFVSGRDGTMYWKRICTARMQPRRE